MADRLLVPDTDLTLDRIIFGSVRFGTDRCVETTAHQLLDAYLDMGCRTVDTARIYLPPTPGCGEEVIGRWIRRTGRRHDLTLMTKGGHPEIQTMHTPRMTRADMESDLHDSLRALQTDYVDVYYYHRDDVSIPVGELIETMEDFRRAGKIRYYACSNWTTARMQEADAYAAAHGYRGFVANQCLYNAGVGHMNPPGDDTLCAADENMIAYHSASKNVMTPYSGLAGGYFQRLLDDPSAAARSNYHTPGNICAARRMEEIARRYDATLTQTVLGFLLTRPFPVAALAGSSSLSHLQETMQTLHIPFQPGDYADM
ncbi:MAG: aldo/keto reductase [Clostridia bacterium]|nr:aldo/keto reductase [Clostridia bacterium]